MSDRPASGVTHLRVGWFELFYDLIIVAAVYYFGHALISDPTWIMGSWIAVTVAITFVLWLLTSLSLNVFPADDARRRLLVLVQMIALVLAALSSGHEKGLSNATGMVSLAVAVGSISGVYLIAARSATVGRDVARMIGIVTAIAGVVLLVGAFASPDERWSIGGPAPWLLALAMGAVAVVLFGPALGRLARSGAVDREHLGERLGQLVIIVLGESFISLISALSDQAVIPNPVFLVLTFLVVFSIWAVYFSSVLPSGVPTAPDRLRAWLLVHLLLLFGAISAAAGFSALASTTEGVAHGGAKEWTALPLLSVLLAITLLTWMAPSRPARLLGLHLSACAVLLVLVLLGIFVTDGGTNWEVVVGSIVVMADAVLSTRLTRPYSSGTSPTRATRASGSGPSPS